LKDKIAGLTFGFLRGFTRLRGFRLRYSYDGPSRRGRQDEQDGRLVAAKFSTSGDSGKLAVTLKNFAGAI
jgi:hypothetical protein